MSELDLVLFFRSTLVSLTVYTQKFHKNQKVEFGSITHMLHVSMYGIFTYIWLISVVNVGKYSIHGAFG